MAIKKVKIGLAGCGLIGRHHFLPGIRRSAYAECIGVSTSTEAKARALALEMGIPKWYPDFESMLEDSDIEAVVIATPNFLHHQQVIAAAGACKHVLCEKPMALDMVESLGMVDACKKSKVTFMVAHHLRYKACNQRVKEILDSGELGKVSTCHIQWSFNNTNGIRCNDWHTDKKLSGGGQLMNVSSHCVDLLVYLLGSAKKVSAFMSLNENAEVEDVSIVMIEFTNGVLAVAEGSYSEEGTENNLEVFGNRASLVVKNACSIDNRGSLQVLPEGEIIDFSQDVTPYTAEIDYFCSAIKEGFEPVSSGRRVLETMRILMAAYKSVETGRHIDINDINFRAM